MESKIGRHHRLFRQCGKERKEETSLCIQRLLASVPFCVLEVWAEEQGFPE